MFSFNIGVLLQFVLGRFLSLRATNAFTCALCALQLACIFFIKESPYFLVASKQDERAKRCLSWLRASNSDAVEKEFSSIKERLETRQNPLVSIRRLFSQRNYKGFVYCMGVSFLADLTGRVAILTYATKTFKETSYDDSCYVMTIWLGICNVLFTIIPMLWSDKVGRKFIIIVSSTVTVLMHLLSGFVLILVKNFNWPWLQWVLFASLTGYLCSNSACVTCIFTLRGEILSENSRGLASGFSSMALAFSIVVSTKCFQSVSDHPLLGLWCAFTLLACFSTLLILFTWIVIPETKNKNFEEIQMALYGVKVEEHVVVESTRM